MVCVNHSQLNPLRNVVLAKFALADAAEVFVVLAGYAAGTVYGRALDRQGWPVAAGATMRRAAVVYVAHIVLVVAFAALVSAISEMLGESYIYNAKLAPLGDPGFEGVQQFLLLRFQPFNMDILPLYVVLLTLLAAVLPLLRSPGFLLGLSFAIYVAAQVLTLNLPKWPEEHWFFNPLAWQLLFFIGVVLGYSPLGESPRSVPFRGWLVVACVIYLLVSRSVHFLLPRVDALQVFAPFFPTPEGKTWLHPMRLLSLLAMAYLAGHFVPPEATWLRGRWAAPFVLMGQHGLSVFCTTVPLAFLSDVIINHSEHLGHWQWLEQAGLNVGVIVTLVSVAALAAWLKPARASEPAGGLL
jgi:hypothetical protein